MKIAQNITLLKRNANEHLSFFRSIITLFCFSLSERDLLSIVSLLALKTVLLKLPKQQHLLQLSAGTAVQATDHKRRSCLVCSLKGREEKIICPETFWKSVNWGVGVVGVFFFLSLCISQVAAFSPYIKAKPQEVEQLESYSSDGLSG